MLVDATVETQRQGTVRTKGVVLRRLDTSSGDRNIYFFLKRYGPTWVFAPGAGRGKIRFGGATDPLIWSIVDIYRTPSRVYLKNLDVKDDFWALRKMPKRLRLAMEWARVLSSTLMVQQENDNILALFYWSMKFLENPKVPSTLIEWRFFWRWLKLWGTAPEIRVCHECGKEKAKGWYLTKEGVFCADCKMGKNGGIAIDSTLLTVLKNSAFLKKADFVEWGSRLDLVDSLVIKKCNKLLIEALQETV